jgi:arginine exporter protein ArgO
LEPSLLVRIARTAVEAQIILMTIMVIGYVSAKDYSHATYWFFAIGLTTVVTWWLK